MNDSAGKCNFLVFADMKSMASSELGKSSKENIYLILFLVGKLYRIEVIVALCL